MFQESVINMNQMLHTNNRNHILYKESVILIYNKILIVSKNVLIILQVEKNNTLIW